MSGPDRPTSPGQAPGSCLAIDCLNVSRSCSLAPVRSRHARLAAAFTPTRATRPSTCSRRAEWTTLRSKERLYVSQDVPMGRAQHSLVQLNERSREIFRQIVESYLATGEPVGSRNLSRLITTPLSPASVRNVMADLEQLGLIYAPHISAGRLPTELGLRFFVDALMEIGDLGESDRREMEAKVAVAGKSLESVLNEASGMLSGLTRAAGVVLAAKSNLRLKHIEFVRLEP